MARRKQTEALDPDTEGLPALTDKQLAFVMAMLEGMSASDAYRKAYGAEKMQPQTIWSKASALKANGKVRVWLARARAEASDKGAYTLAEHVAELDRLKTVAEESGNIGAAVQAEQLKGKVLGYHIERREDVTNRDPAAILDRLRKSLGNDGMELFMQTDMGKKLARRAGKEAMH